MIIPIVGDELEKIQSIDLDSQTIHYEIELDCAYKEACNYFVSKFFPAVKKSIINSGRNPYNWVLVERHVEAVLTDLRHHPVEGFSLNESVIAIENRSELIEKIFAFFLNFYGPRTNSVNNYINYEP